MKRFLVALILCTALSTFAADTKPTADVLGHWVGGKWPLEGKMLDTDYSKATTEINGKAVQFRTINEFRNPDYIDWWSEYSTDGGMHWIKMGGGSEKRQK